MNKIIILNGPNLNLLGEREKEKYGNITLKDIENNCKKFAIENNIDLSLFQSNIEGELVEEIQKKSKVKIEVPVAELIDFKEALIFAFLGLLKLQGSVNCLASVTGAKQDHSTGKIFIPKNPND